MNPQDDELTRAFQEAARRRADLHHALVDVERAISSPAAGRLETWTGDVVKRLTILLDAIDEHIEVTERPEGLYDEILHRARLSPYALTTELPYGDVERLAATIRATLAEGLELRLRGAGDKKAYRIHNRLGEPCPVCGQAVTTPPRSVKLPQLEALRVKRQGASKREQQARQAADRHSGEAAERRLLGLERGQVVLARHRDAGEVVHAADVPGVEARGPERAAEARRAREGVLDRLGQPAAEVGLALGGPEGLDARVEDAAGTEIRHGVLPRIRSW